jgi:hypothetical protein
MVQSAEARHDHNSGSSHLSWLYRSALRRVFVQGVVDAVLMIAADVITNQPAQVTFIEHDYLVQQFPAVAADPAIRDSILPGTPKGGSDQLAAQVFKHLCCFSDVFAVTVKEQIARCGISRESLSNLLRDPGAGGMFRGIEVEDLPAAMVITKKQ